MEPQPTIWRIGDYTFDLETHWLTGQDAPQHLERNEARLLTFLILKFSGNPEYTDDNIANYIWGRKTGKTSLSQAKYRLARILGPKYIGTRPYHLLVKPQLISRDMFPIAAQAPEYSLPGAPTRAQVIMDSQAKLETFPREQQSKSLFEAVEQPPRRNEVIWFDPASKLMWRMPMAESAFLPINAEDLEKRSGKFGVLRQIEVPLAVRDEVLVIRPDLLMPREIYDFLRDVWSHPKRYHSILNGQPALKAWVKRIWDSSSPSSKDLERKQLLNFYRAMQSPQIDEQLLPNFTYGEVSCWRVFTQAFPESIFRLEEASSIKELSTQKRATIAALCSTLAMIKDNWPIAIKAAAITSRLLKETSAETVYSYREFKLIRHFLYAAVEAGACPVERFLNFIHNPHHPVEWEFRFNREYYESDTDARLAATVARKLERPLNRDEHTRKITEYHREFLPKGLLEKAYHAMR
jgi:hypothetical protein